MPIEIRLHTAEKLLQMKTNQQHITASRFSLLCWCGGWTCTLYMSDAIVEFRLSSSAPCHLYSMCRSESPNLCSKLKMTSLCIRSVLSANLQFRATQDTFEQCLDSVCRFGHSFTTLRRSRQLLFTPEKEVTGEIPKAQSCIACKTSTLTRMAQQHHHEKLSGQTTRQFDV